MICCLVVLRVEGHREKLGVVEAVLISLDPPPSFPISFVNCLPRKRCIISPLSISFGGRSRGWDRCVSSTQAVLSKCLLKGWRELALRKYFLGFTVLVATEEDREQK